MLRNTVVSYIIIIPGDTLPYYYNAYSTNLGLRVLRLPGSNITIRSFPSIAMVTPNNPSIHWLHESGTTAV